MKAVITFKDDRGRYVRVTKVFKDERHINNYIAKVDGKYGRCYIDHDIIDDGK